MPVFEVFEHDSQARLEQQVERVGRDKAAREVDDAAVAYANDQDELALLIQTGAAARRSLDIANTQYREGYSDFQRVLDAQSALLAQQDNYLLSRSSAVSNLIALYRALGGGWYSPQPLLDDATRKQMQARTDWGDMLDQPAPTQATPDQVTRDE